MSSSDSEPEPAPDRGGEPASGAGAATMGDPVRRGVRDAVPLAVPTVPFGLVFGVAVADSGIAPALAWSTSSLIFAGAAQLTVVTLVGSATAALSVIVSAVVVNARHLMYSAALAPAFRRQPRWFRWVGAYFLIDQVFALVDRKADADPGWYRRYYLGAGVFFWAQWQASTGVGVLLGAGLPESWSLDFAVPLMFTGLVVVGFVRRPAVVAAAVGFLVAAAASPLPNRSGLLVGALAGVVAGALVDREST